MAIADTAELIVSLTLRDRLGGGLRNLNTQLSGMQKGLTQVGRGIGQVGSGLDKILTRGAIAAAAGLGAVITTAASFEQAFTGVEKTVDGTDAQLAELEETLRAMARTMPVSFEELAAIGETGGALGIARESIDEFVDVVARLAVSTDLSADQAATALGQLGNVLGLTGSDFEDFSDILVALGNDGASTESQIIDLAARFGAAGRAAGLSNEQILTLASTTASMGIEAEAGGGALSRIFNNLTLDMATASDEGQLLAQTLGVSLDDLKQSWEQDAGSVFEDLLARISELDQFEGAKLLSDLGITNTRDINAIRLLSQGIEEYRDQLETAEGASNALRTESDKFFGTTTGGFNTLKNIARDSLAIVGEELLPEVNEQIQALGAELNKPEVREGLASFGRDLAEGLSGFIDEVKRTDFTPLIDTLKGAAAVAKGAFDAFNALPAPVKQLALAAIVANKVTGGAVGQIAKGLGNIVGGVIKIGFQRGSTPANPLFVSAVGGLGGGGTAVGGTKGGLAGLLGVAGIAAGVLALVTAAGEEVYRAVNPVGRTFNELAAGASGRPASFQLLERDLQALSDATGRPIEDLQSEMIPLLQAGNKTWSQVLDEVRGDGATTSPGGASASFGPTAPTTTAADGSFDRFGSKLDKLATSEVIEHLARTTETGLKDVGNSFQVGIQTGLDPIGDIATRILARAEDPKAPPVMAEIQGHLSGLEEIQSAYLAQGDVTLAAKVQTNIDTLHALIGTADQNNAITERLAADAQRSDEKLARIAADMSPTRAAVQAQADRQYEALAAVRDTSAAVRTGNAILAGKSFDPKVIVQNFVSVSATVLQQQLVSLRTTVGGGGFI